MRSKIVYRSREADGSPNPTDIVVGQRLKQRRTILGLSQEQVADSVGLTFQQVQKYERGTNRIAASRLYEFSRVLDVPVGYFFDGAHADTKSKVQGFADESTVFSHEGTVDKREALELLRLFNSVPSGAPRRKVLALVRTLVSAIGGGSGIRHRGPGRPRKEEAAKARRTPGRSRKADVVQIRRGPGRPRKDA